MLSLEPKWDLERRIPLAKAVEKKRMRVFSGISP